jgi:hypothetical protein
MAAESEAAERWFLARGLPAVLRPGALVHRVWSRSAPALAAMAVFAVNSIVVVKVSGMHTIDIDGRPNLAEGFVLAMLVLVLPSAAATGWFVAKVESTPRRVLIATLSLAIVALGAVFGGPSARISVNVMFWGAAVVTVLILTATGVGSIMGWAAELTLTNLAYAAGMFVRALPVVLLTFLVFFNTYVWLMTSLISRGRLWLGMCFLFLIAAAFLVSSTMTEVRPLLSAPAAVAGDADRLVGTPFEGLPDKSDSRGLSLGQRLNTVFVVAASQVVHVFTVAVMTGMVFFVLGLILVSPPVLDAWTRGNGRPDGHLLGMTLPIPDSLIQTTMLLTAITFMYLAAKAVTDTQYRAQFLDPILDDLRLTIVALGRYRSMTLDQTETQVVQPISTREKRDG